MKTKIENTAETTQVDDLVDIYAGPDRGRALIHMTELARALERENNKLVNALIDSKDLIANLEVALRGECFGPDRDWVAKNIDPLLQ